METQDILFSVQNGAGVVTLNRPQALNALTFAMARALDEKLVEWAANPAVKLVLITAVPGRAFCAGGDIKQVALAAREGGEAAAAAVGFFREEYTLNHRIFTYPKPYVALVDGIVMGGGVGLSAHGSHRLVTEKTLFAMPETGIGFFPDVGASYFLPRCPGKTGTYLALTGASIGAADALHAGFGTHFVKSGKVAALREAIIAAPEKLEAVLKEFSSACDMPSILAPHRALIDACFAKATAEEIVQALEKDGSDFARETVKALRKGSPSSIKIALAQMQKGGQMGFSEVMSMEFRLSQACFHRPDFTEGVRAALIDKDRNPRWNPARLEDVSEAEIEACFQSGASQDLVL